MIPFARIVQYGNTAPQPLKEIKTISHQFDTYVLSTNGDLYGVGANSYGELNNGNNVVQKSWSLVTSGVTEIVVHYNYTLIVRKGETYWYIGESRLYGDSSVFVDITSRIGLMADGTKVELSSVTGNSASLFGISANGDLYGASMLNTRGVLGDGTTVNSVDFKKVASNVKKVISTLNNTFYLDTTYQLYATGWNDGNSLGFGTAGQQNSWGPGGSYNALKDVRLVLASTSCTWVYDAKGQWSTGAAIYAAGSISTSLGSASSTLSQAVGLTPGTDPDNIILQTTNSLYNTMALHVKGSSYIQYSGNQVTMGESMNNTQNNILYRLDIPAEVKLNTDNIFAMGYESFVYYDGEKLYMCGQGRYLPGLAAGVYKFAEIELPLIN